MQLKRTDLLRYEDDENVIEKIELVIPNVCSFSTPRLNFLHSSSFLFFFFTLERKRKKKIFLVKWKKNKSLGFLP